VCDRIAYSGIALSKNSSNLSVLVWRRRIALVIVEGGLLKTRTLVTARTPRNDEDDDHPPRRFWLIRYSAGCQPHMWLTRQGRQWKTIGPGSLAPGLGAKEFDAKKTRKKIGMDILSSRGIRFDMYFPSQIDGPWGGRYLKRSKGDHGPFPKQ
jgi:hypothetical protein